MLFGFGRSLQGIEAGEIGQLEWTKEIEVEGKEAEKKMAVTRGVQEVKGNAKGFATHAS